MGHSGGGGGGGEGPFARTSVPSYLRQIREKKNEEKFKEQGTSPDRSISIA